MGTLDAAVAAGRRGIRDVLALRESDGPVVLGVSGGADSLALAVCAAFVARADGVDMHAIVVDHRLQADSGAVAERAVDQVRSLGLKARYVRVEVGSVGGPEAAARQARQRALVQAAGGGTVMLAHTLDDQAETVLLGLGRGSGPRSIAGMRALDGLWGRPFLGLRRRDTEQICRDAGLSWWTDPHNADPSFRRVRVRTEVLPLLENVLGSGVAEALARTASQVQDDCDLIDAAADRSITDDVEALGKLPKPVRTRVLHRLALAAGALPGELSAVHIAELDRLITDYRGQQRIELPGHVSCRRRDGRVMFSAS